MLTTQQIEAALKFLREKYPNYDGIDWSREEIHSAYYGSQRLYTNRNRRHKVEEAIYAIVGHWCW